MKFSNVYCFVLQGSEDAMLTHFQMSDQLYVKANIPPTDKVNLWLGVSTIGSSRVGNKYNCFISGWE